MIEQSEKLKTEYTDKYVAVDGSRAELSRFKDLVGQVKTVNMSGRALVEFVEYNLNIGWYDIDLDYLKVVDKPLPKPKEDKKKPAAKKAAPAAKKPAAAPTGEKKLSPLELARQQGGAGKATVAKPGKPSSTADILAAARGGGGKASAAPAAKAPAKSAQTDASDKAAKVDRSKMSVADMLAAARGGAAPAAKSEPEAVPAEEVAEEVVEEVAVEETVETPAEEAAPAEASGGKVDKASMSLDEILAYCREQDA